VFPYQYVHPILRKVRKIGYTMRMISSRLSVLCGERRVHIAEVARSTGLARNTVSAIYHDRVARFDRATLDALCRYFECDIGDLLHYVPERPVSERKESADGG